MLPVFVVNAIFCAVNDVLVLLLTVVMFPPTVMTVKFVLAVTALAAKTIEPVALVLFRVMLLNSALVIAPLLTARVFPALAITRLPLFAPGEKMPLELALTVV